MTFLLFHWSHWEHGYLDRVIHPDAVVFSKGYRSRFPRNLSGCLRVLKVSHRGDTIICWYDAQAVLCWWICQLLLLKRNIVCINLLLKDKPTWKNRLAQFAYRRALLAKNFKASVTSTAYGEWLNSKLGIDASYTLLHDVYHDSYEMPQFKESKQNIVFCGGCNGRDWSLMLEIVKATPEVKFYMAMDSRSYRGLMIDVAKEDVPSNVIISVDIPFMDFMHRLCQSKIVSMPVDGDAPQGLIVMWEAAANHKLILTSDTVTMKEYFPAEQRLGKDPLQWRDAIRYYLEHEGERHEAAEWFHNYLKDNCGEEYFARTIKSMADSFSHDVS